MLQTGNLKKIGLPNLLNSIEQDRRSGTLFIRSPKGIGSIDFCKGMIAQAESPIMPRRIGRILIDTGVLTEKQLQQALKAQEENGKTKPLGEILIRLGFIDASKLQEIIRLQIIESVNSMLDWRDAVFRFEDQEVSSGNDIQLSVQDIMTEAANYARGPSQEQAAVESETSAESPPWVLLIPRRRKRRRSCRKKSIP